MREKPLGAKQKELTPEEKKALHMKYMKEMGEAKARTRTISVTPEQGEMEWQKWQKIKKEISDRKTDPGELRSAAGPFRSTLLPSIVNKITETGSHAILSLTPKEADDLFDYLDAMSASQDPDAKEARALMQYFDPELPMPLPENLQRTLKRLIEK